ncbi:MAG: SRPBCC domain-containing protein [Chloroflexi bacterium]|nr:SRPBCC domain-containing protein [Chloroflexota bacterium]
MATRIIGKTKQAGFQIGARKTFPISIQQAWDFITSDKGIRLWLGNVKNFRFDTGHTYKTSDGATGEVRVVNFRENIRLTWQPPEWQHTSTIQVRVIPSGRKSIISFHQENLANASERAQMRLRWQRVLEEIETTLGGAK